MVLLAGLLVPGWCLLSLLGLKSLSPALAIPTAIGMGLGVVSLAAWLAWLTGTGMTGAAVLVGSVAAVTAVARIVWRKRASSMARPSGFEVGAGTLAAVGTGFAVATGPWLGQSADPFYHMAAAQALLRENRALPQDVFFGVTMPYPDVTSGSLHLVLAWVSLVGGIVPAWVALTIFGAAFTTVCLAVLAREVTRSTVAALIGATLYLVLALALDMRSAGYPNRIAPGLVWLSFAFLLRFARSDSRSWRELVPTCLLAFTAGSVHSGMAPLVVVMIGATFVAAALVAVRGRRLRSLGPLAIACAAVMLVMLPLLAVRVAAALPPLGIEASLATQAPRLRVHMPLGYAFIDPRFWFDGWVTMTTVGTLCLLGRARRQLLDGDPGAALLWGGSLIVPAVAITPLVASMPNELYFFARIAELLLPLLLVTLGWELSRLPGLPRLSTLAPKPYTVRRLIAGYLLAGATFYIIGDQLPHGVLYRYLGTNAYTVSASRAKNLTVLWADRLQALKTAGPGTILADWESSYELAGLTGRTVVAVPFGHGSYQDEARDGALRRGDVADALNPSADPTALLSVLARYRVTFVVVDQARDGQATWDWIAGQKALATIAGGSGWKLYRFDSGRLDNALDIPLNGGAGMFPSRVIAGRAVFVRVTSPGQGAVAQVTALGLTSGATYQTQFVLPDQAGATVTAPLLLPDSARVDRYTVTVSVPGSAPIVAGQVEVGHAYEAEYFAGVIFDLSSGAARLPGWNSVDNPAYHRGQAASALLAGSMARHPLAEPAGDYCLSLLVFDAGDGTAHTLDVGLGGNVVTTTWSGHTAGIRELEVAAHSGSSGQLTYWVPGGTRVGGVIVDRITLYPPAAGRACAPGST